MKRDLAVAAMAIASCLVPIALHPQAGQPKVFANAKPMSFGHNLKTYYLVEKTNITAILEAVPEDRFFATPPGFSAELGTREQASIGAEAGMLADAQYRMCVGIATGRNPSLATLPGTLVMKDAMPSKAAMLDAVAKSFAACDPLIDNFDDAKVDAMVQSLHALQPYGTSLFNIISHDREDYGRIKSYMINFGIKSPKEIDTRDPDNPQDLYLCGGTESKTSDNCR